MYTPGWTGRDSAFSLSAEFTNFSQVYYPPQRNIVKPPLGVEQTCCLGLRLFQPPTEKPQTGL
jgi:hypothetical protein